MDLIKTVLPFLTTVLAGPVPGIATGLLNQIFPNKEIDTPEKLQKEYQKITQYENSDVDKNSQDYLMQRRINESYSKSR
jgi:hypothetical protein